MGMIANFLFLRNFYDLCIHFYIPASAISTLTLKIRILTLLVFFFYFKFNSWYLKSGNLTHFTEDYLLWHWFGRVRLPILYCLLVCGYERTECYLVTLIFHIQSSTVCEVNLVEFPPPLHGFSYVVFVYLQATKDSNSDLVHVYKQYIKTINPVNLALFIDTYCGRSDLKIQRPPPQTDASSCTIK